jgi:hypothetical protein
MEKSAKFSNRHFLLNGPLSVIEEGIQQAGHRVNTANNGTKRDQIEAQTP